MDRADPSAASKLVEMRGSTNSFDGFLANSDIDFVVRYGEIFIRGKKVELKSPRDAISHGIGMVHQHFMLISQHTVLENIILGIEAPDGWTKVSSQGTFESVISQLKKKLSTFSEEHRKRINETATKYDLKINLDAKIWQLSVGERQRAEILKTIYRGAKLLVLDEPGSNLTPKESESLSHMLKLMSKEGISIVLITHHLKEAMSISDSITVLRAGKKIGTLERGQYSQSILSQMVIGHDITFAKATGIDDDNSRALRAVLQIQAISAKNDLGLLSLNGVSLEVRESEILGIAGVEGNGQRELLEVVMGLRKPVAGRVLINNEDVTGKRTSDILSLGVAYIPQDRNAEGLVGDFDIIENLILDRYNEKEFSDRFLIQRKNASHHALSMINEFDIKCRGPHTYARTLSGGNAQRVIIARELSRKPALIVANQPTRGLDVASSEFVLTKLIEHAKRGCTVILSSNELDQLMRVSDRIAVMYEGRIQGIVKPTETNLQQIGLLMLGKSL